MSAPELVEAWPCDGGKCDPRHPLHCCHLGVSVRTLIRPGLARFFWQCVVCGLTSRAAVVHKVDALGRIA